MLSDRFNELIQKENPPMLMAFSGYSSLTKYQDCYIMYVNALTADPIRSFKATLTENDRVKRFGFTSGELERARKDCFHHMKMLIMKEETIVRLYCK